MIKVLVLCDDVWHPGEVIERGLEDLQDCRFHFDFVRDAKDILTEDMLEKYPVIMNCKSNNLHAGNHAPWFEDGVTEVGVKELEAYVKNGGGFLSVHAGNTYHETNCPEYAAFVGNHFVTHPPRCRVEVKVVGKHPVTEGVTDFSIRDEHYQITNLASDAQILLESVSENGGKQVASYVRTLGKGRICVLTPGHIMAVWKHEMFRKILENAINWCAKQGD